MLSMPSQLIQGKTFRFALEIIKLYKKLIATKNEYVLARQILKSGTSVGANVEEAIGGISRKDFRHKMSIAYKEARETKYWLSLLYHSDYIDRKDFSRLIEMNDQICRILFRIVESARS